MPSLHDREKFDHEADTITLVPTNQEALTISAEHSIRCSQQENKQLFQWAAVNNNITALHAPLNAVRQLRNYIGVCIGMRVMLLDNQFQQAGLVNGARGEIKDIV